MQFFKPFQWPDYLYGSRLINESILGNKLILVRFRLLLRTICIEQVKPQRIVRLGLNRLFHGALLKAFSTRRDAKTSRALKLERIHDGESAIFGRLYRGLGPIIVANDPGPKRILRTINNDKRQCLG